MSPTSTSNTLTPGIPIAGHDPRPGSPCPCAPIQPATPFLSLARPVGLGVQAFSDLKVDSADSDRQRLAPGADVLVVASDTCAGIAEGFAHLRRAAPQPTTIVAAAGDHAVYGATRASESARARAAAPSLGIAFLEDEVAVIRDARFLDRTLWIDDRLSGEHQPSVAMSVARRGPNDHQANAGRDGPARQCFRPEEVARRHGAFRAFRAATLPRPVPGPTVGVAPHAPHPGVVAPRHGRDPLSAAFASDLREAIVTDGPNLRVVGHTHHPADFTVARTRLGVDPHGYRDEGGAAFYPVRVIDIPRAAARENRS